MMSEIAGSPCFAENPDMGVRYCFFLFFFGHTHFSSDNLNLRSHWARSKQFLMGEIMFDTRMSRPERAFNIHQNPVLDWVLDLKDRSWLVNVDSDWAEVFLLSKI